jgi:hypothetical protein
VLVAAAVVLVLLVIYPLTIGPVYWLAANRYVDFRVLLIYWPIVRGCEACGLDDALRWYMGLWGKP